MITDPADAKTHSVTLCGTLPSSAADVTIESGGRQPAVGLVNRTLYRENRTLSSG